MVLEKSANPINIADAISLSSFTMRELDRKAYVEALKRISNQTKSVAIEPHVLLKLI